MKKEHIIFSQMEWQTGMLIEESNNMDHPSLRHVGHQTFL